LVRSGEKKGKGLLILLPWAGKRGARQTIDLVAENEKKKKKRGKPVVFRGGREKRTGNFA